MQNLRVREKFAQCEKFVAKCSKLSKVSYCPWERFTFGSSLLIMMKCMATVKKKSVTSCERNSDHKN
jgi:hypothetical protein